MIWLFWGLLGTCLGGLFLLAVLARRGRSKLHPARRPSSLQLLRAAGYSFESLLWTVSHPFGTYGRSRHFTEDPLDASKDYVREQDQELEEQRQHSRK